ncbi:MAG TPA: MBL fold metallo-hydrolase, partial [Desulfohalobiaceae bacterium]|nr:MBL fold metallo-hydrolase [Desulfohalobiaceae bacterium]
TMALGEIRMVALDVDEGQAILFEENNHGLLVDTGPVYNAGQLVKDLKSYGVKELDYLILTHLHPDHSSGLFHVLEAFPQVTVLESGQRLSQSQSTEIIRWTQNRLNNLKNHRIVLADDKLKWQGANIHFLWPERVKGTNLNRNSLVTSINYKEHTALIMGDAGGFVEEKLKDNGVLPKDVNVLVAGHHGSKKTSTQSFLEYVSPEIAIISIDKNNIRGYPHPDTVNRLKKFSEKLFQTWNGDVEIIVDKNRLENCELRITNCELRIADNYELRISNCEFRIGDWGL